MANYRNDPDKKIVELQVIQNRLSQLMHSKGYNQLEMANAAEIGRAHV